MEVTRRIAGAESLEVNCRTGTQPTRARAATATLCGTGRGGSVGPNAPRKGGRGTKKEETKEAETANMTVSIPAALWNRAPPRTG
jgi:hypothetical protein